MSLLDVILDLLSFDFLDWYGEKFMGFPRDLLEFLFIWIVYYIFLQLILHILPFIRNILYVFGGPFRYVHVWLHIWAAQRCSKSPTRVLEGYNVYPSETIDLLEQNISVQSIVRAAFFTGIGAQDASKVYIREPENSRQALFIATAPLVGAVPLFVFMVLTAEYFAVLGSPGVLLHSYLSAITLGVSMPSTRDFQFYTNTTLVESRVSPPFVIWVYAVFMINLYLDLAKTENLLLGLFSGFLWSVIYLGSLAIVARIIAPAPKHKNVKEEFTIFRPLDERPEDRPQFLKRTVSPDSETEFVLMGDPDEML